MNSQKPSRPTHRPNNRTRRRRTPAAGPASARLPRKRAPAKPAAAKPDQRHLPRPRSSAAGNAVAGRGGSPQQRLPGAVEQVSYWVGD